jgi:pimeloyl-ACP methyl ester carboxylesterase
MDTEWFDIRSTDGVTLRGEVHGAGASALVFVHGWAGRRRHWDAQLPAFTEGRRVVAFDLAGHGDSGIDRDVWSIEAFANDVIAVVDHLELEELALVGHSLGGSVIVAVAEQLGARVRALVGIDTWSSVGVRTSTADIEAGVLLPEMRADYPAAAAHFARDMCGPTASPALVDRVVREVTEMRSDVAIAILERAITRGPEPLEDGLRTFPGPKWAISSQTFRPKDTALLAGFGVRCLAVERTGHYLMLERPDDFNRALAMTLGPETRGQ